MTPDDERNAGRGRVCRGDNPRLDRRPHVVLHARCPAHGTKTRSGSQCTGQAMTSADSQAQKPERINRRRLVLNLLGTPLFFALFLFLPAGTWLWAKGWLFVLVMVASSVLSVLYVWRVNPELVVARINPHRGTKGWDKVLGGFSVLPV